MLPKAVPVSVNAKSLLSTPVTASENVTVYSICVAVPDTEADAPAARTMELTVGESCTVTVVARYVAFPAVSAAFR